MTPAAPAANGIQVPPERGCVLCRYGAFDSAGERTCTCPDAGLPAPTPVVLVRDARGACGPDARFLDFPGLHS